MTAGVQNQNMFALAKFWRAEKPMTRLFIENLPAGREGSEVLTREARIEAHLHRHHKLASVTMASYIASSNNSLPVVVLVPSEQTGVL